MLTSLYLGTDIFLIFRKFYVLHIPALLSHHEAVYPLGESLKRERGHCLRYANFHTIRYILFSRSRLFEYLWKLSPTWKHAICLNSPTDTIRY